MVGIEGNGWERRELGGQKRALSPPGGGGGDGGIAYFPDVGCRIIDMLAKNVGFDEVFDELAIEHYWFARSLLDQRSVRRSVQRSSRRTDHKKIKLWSCLPPCSFLFSFLSSRNVLYLALLASISLPLKYDHEQLHEP